MAARRLIPFMEINGCGSYVKPYLPWGLGLGASIQICKLYQPLISSRLSKPKIECRYAHGARLGLAQPQPHARQKEEKGKGPGIEAEAQAQAQARSRRQSN